MQALQQLVSALTAIVLSLSAQVANLPRNSQLAAAAPTSGLVGYWNFNEGSGTTAADSSGNSNTAALSGTTWATGKVGSGSLQFDGSTSKVVVGKPATLNNLSSFTYSAWVNMTSSNSSSVNPIMQKGAGSAIFKGFYFGYSGRVSAIVRTGGTLAQSVTSNNSYTLNSWDHWAMTYDDAGDRLIHIYKNGVEVSYTSQVAATGIISPDSTYELAIGATPGNYFSRFKGFIDEPRVYNRALSVAEVSDVYNDGGSGSIAVPPPPPISDTTAPVVSNISASNITPSAATVSWSTDESSDAQVEYGLTASYGSLSSLSSSLATSHSLSLSNLSASTLYHYRVKSKDASGNQAVSADYTFTTAAPAVVPPPATTTAPSISSFSASPSSITSGQSSTLSWVVSGNPTPALSINQNIGTVTGTSKVVSPNQTTTYTLTATNSAGNTAVQTTVNVNAQAYSPQPVTGAPVLFFSDLDSGPKTGGENNKGAYVCVWGRNFGSSRGSASITIGGGAADNYPYWTDNTGNPAAPNKACFQLGANAQTGNIVMTNSRGVSNGLPFTVRSAGTNPDGIWCMSPSGSDSNNGHFTSNGNGGTGCKATWAKMKALVAPGDIVYFLDGFVAATIINSNSTYSYLPFDGSGTPGMPKAAVTYPGARVTVGDVTLDNIASVIVGQYWTVSGFNFVCSMAGRGCFSIGNSPASNAAMVRDIRVVGVDCQAPAAYNAWAGCIGAANTHHVKFYGNNAHNVGCGFGKTGGVNDGATITDQTWQIRCPEFAGTGTISSSGTTVTGASGAFNGLLPGAHICSPDCSNPANERVVQSVNNSAQAIVDSPWGSDLSAASWRYVPVGPTKFLHTIYPGQTQYDWDFAWNYIHNSTAYIGVSLHQQPNFNQRALAAYAGNSEPGTGAAKITVASAFTLPSWANGDRVDITKTSDTSLIGRRYVKVIDSVNAYLYADPGLTIPVTGSGNCGNSCGYGVNAAFRAYNWSIHDNYFYKQNGYCLTIADPDPDSGPVLVYNNIFSHCGQGPLTGGSSAPGQGMTALQTTGRDGYNTIASGVSKIFNNTFYDSGRYLGSVQVGSPPTLGALGFIDDLTKWELNNNIIYNTSPTAPYLYTLEPGNMYGSRNLFYGGFFNSKNYGALPSGLRDTITADPLFTDPANGDFTLRSGSPAIGAGVDLGLGRNLGATWGAVARVVSSPPPAAPSTPTPVLPTISNLVGQNTTQTTTQISWETSVATNGQVFYGTTGSYGLSSSLMDNATKKTSHIVTLSNLTPNTTYHFKVTSIDASNQSVSSSDFTFTTLNQSSQSSSGLGQAPSSGGGGPTNTQTVSTPVVYIPAKGGGGGSSASNSTSLTSSPNLFSRLLPLTVPISRTNASNPANQTLSLQTLLFLEKYLSVEPSVASFDLTLEAAVKKYQCDKAIVCQGDLSSTGWGNVGPTTRASLNALMKKYAASAKAPASQSKINLTVTLSIGKRHPEVLTLQNFLISLGLLSADSNTGYFGNLTRAAVRQYQCQNMQICSGDESTTGWGMVGRLTRAKMGGM